MVRYWGPKLRGVREAIAAAVRAEQLAGAADLPTPLHGANFEIVATQSRAPRTLFPVGMRILPPAGGALNGEVTKGLDGFLTFPVALVIKGLDEADMLDLLEEAVGLLIDAIDADPTLGGLTGGWADPGVIPQQQELDLSGTILQEIGISLRIRG